MGDYLEEYVEHNRLPVQTAVRVESLTAAPEGGGYTITAGPRTYHADQVIVATGAFQRPHVPDFAGQLDPSIRQLHSADYRNPGQLADGPVLVVGVSHSGADLAHELATAGHRTILSGKAHGQLPFSVDSRRGMLALPIMRFVAWNLLTLNTPIGRKMAPKVRKGGGPLLRIRRGDLERAGVEWLEAHRLSPGLRLDRPADHRRGRLADAAPRRGRLRARPLRPRHPVPVLVHLDAGAWGRARRGPRRGPGRGAGRQPGTGADRPRRLGSGLTESIAPRWRRLVAQSETTCVPVYGRRG
jgi:hypothetical protein